MTEAIIESMEWHKDQLFKLFDKNNLNKIENDIYEVKSDLNEIIEKMKKRVSVKATSKRKAHYRMQEGGQKKKDTISSDMREAISDIKNSYQVDKVGLVRTSTQSMIDHTHFDSFIDQIKSLKIDKSSLKPDDDGRTGYDRGYYHGNTTDGKKVSIIRIGPGAFGVANDYFALLSKEPISIKNLSIIGDRLNKSW